MWACMHSSLPRTIMQGAMIVFYRNFICISTVSQGKCHSTWNIRWMLWPRRAMHVVTYSWLCLQWTRFQACRGYLERNEQPLHITISSLDKSTLSIVDIFLEHILFDAWEKQIHAQLLFAVASFTNSVMCIDGRPNVMQTTHSLTLVHEHALTTNVVIINFYWKRTSLLPVLSLKFMVVTLRRVDEICAPRRLKLCITAVCFDSLKKWNCC